MNQGSIMDNYQSEFLKNQQEKLYRIEEKEKQNTEVRVQSNNVSIDTLQYNAGSDLIYIWLGVIFLLYLKIFKRRSRIAKGISYIVNFKIFANIAEFIAIKNLINNPGSKLITELITALPILIIVVYNLKKFKNSRRRTVYEK